MTLTITNRLGLISVGLPYFDIQTAQTNLDAARELLSQHWLVFGPREVVTDRDSLEKAIHDFRFQEPVDALVLQLGTFPDGEAPLLLAERLGVPVLLHSLPEPDLQHNIDLNSLCGINLSTYTLTALGHPHTFVHGSLHDPVVFRTLSAQVRAALVLAALKTTRIKLIGFRAPGFYPCVFDELLLRRTFGTALDYIDLGQVKDAFSAGKSKNAPAAHFPTIAGGELPPEAVQLMEKNYGAISHVLEQNDARVVAMKDWPELLDIQAAGSLWPALGWIMDDGFLLAPEGDVHAALTMALVHLLGGGVPFFSDISAVDDTASALLLWHYGGAPSLAHSQDEIRYGSEGREVQFTLKPGPATLLRLGMHQNRFRLLAVRSQVLDKPVTVRRAGAWVHTTHTPSGEVMHHILDHGWEHHFLLGYGDLIPELGALSKLSGIPLTVL